MIRQSLYFFLLIFSIISCQRVNKPLANQFTPQLIASGFSFTEGPSSDNEGHVYFTDQPNDIIYKWDCHTSAINEFLSPTGRANGLYWFKHKLYSCSDLLGQIWVIDCASKQNEKITFHPNLKRLNGPNDLWIRQKDSSLYFTDPFYLRPWWDFKTAPQAKRNVYRYQKHMGLQVIDSTLMQPNGIVANLEESILYVSDIDANKTYAYTILEDGTVKDKRLFCTLGSDGMTVDQLGNVYLTGDGVTIFNKNGEQIQHIAVPEDWTANVCFGGAKQNELFITASKSVYHLKMNVHGQRK